MKKVGVSMDWFKSSRGKKTEDYEKDYLTRYKKGEKSNSEYNDIVSKIKSSRAELLKTNSELQEKTEENSKSTQQTIKQNELSREINNSKKELSEIKDQINKPKMKIQKKRKNHFQQSLSQSSRNII